MPATTERYLGRDGLREKARGHVTTARHFHRAARIARRDGWPDVAARATERVDHHLRVARWLAAGCPPHPLADRKARARCYPELEPTGVVRALDQHDGEAYLLCRACYVAARDEGELTPGVAVAPDEQDRCDICHRWLMEGAR